MRPIVRPLALLFTLSLAPVVFLATEETAGPLDGKTFEVMVIDQSSGEETADTLLFANGTFDSVACRQYGFGKAPYEATQEGETWTFTAEAVSPEEGTTTWVGTISGDAIEGTMEWAKSGQNPMHYEFAGALKKEAR